MTDHTLTFTLTLTRTRWTDHIVTTLSSANSSTGQNQLNGATSLNPLCPTHKILPPLLGTKGHNEHLNFEFQTIKHNNFNKINHYYKYFNSFPVDNRTA